MHTLQGLKDFSRLSAPSYPLNIFAHILYICVPKTPVYACGTFGCFVFDGFKVIPKRVRKKIWVKKILKKAEEQFSESLHCYSPTPPIGRRRTKN